jgi:uncharacterized sulfatase
MCAGVASLGAAAAVTERRPPNILFVLSDNQSWCHTGATGDPVVKTPAFDRVAEEGVLFTHAYAPAPSCTPSRSAILTGQDIWRLEEGGVLWGSLPKRCDVYPRMLEAQGYHVGYTGKGWGPGKWNDDGRAEDPVGAAYNRLRQEAPKGINPSDYTRNFEAFLNDRPAGAPFCFWLGAREPHRPFPEGEGLKSGKRLEDVRVPAFLPDCPVVRSEFLDYYLEIEWLDAHLGRILDHLERVGELDNTLIVVTSDNGIQMPRGITTLYDHGVRVPLAIRWGERCKGGRVIDDFVNLTGLAPTFLQAAGLEVPDTMTGITLMPLLDSEGSGRIDPVRGFVVTAQERHTLCRSGELPYPSRMIRTHEYLYIRNYAPDRWPAGAPDYEAAAQGFYGDVDNGPTKSWMIEHAEDPDVKPMFDLCFGKRPSDELYAVADDPDQIHNIAQDPAHSETVASLRARMQAHLKADGDPRMADESPWDHYRYFSPRIRGRADRITNRRVIP